MNEQELKEILETSNGKEWQIKSIKALALCMIDIKNELKSIKKQMKWLQWLLASIMILLIVKVV